MGAGGEAAGGGGARAGGVAAHDGFFGRLVAAVPGRFYAEPGSGAPGARPEPVNRFAHTKSERALLKQRAKQAHKVAKRRNLAPGAAEFGEAGEGGEGAPPPMGAGGEAPPPPSSPTSAGGAALPSSLRDRPATPSARPTIDLEGLVEAAAAEQGGAAGSAPGIPASARPADLRARLQQQIAALRERRGALSPRGGENASLRKARDFQAKARAKSKLQAKMKRTAEAGGTGKGSAARLDFGQVDFKGAQERVEGPRKRKQTKKDALRDAERKRARLERMKGTVEGVEAERGHAMERALKRAQGEKVLDDPKLLKKALRKDRREKKRKREAWKDRSKEEADGVKARQKKRNDNLKARAQIKKARKMGVKVPKNLGGGKKGGGKGPKGKGGGGAGGGGAGGTGGGGGGGGKLRPGFEGRKSGPIQSPGKGGAGGGGRRR